MNHRNVDFNRFYVTENININNGAIMEFCAIFDKKKFQCVNYFINTGKKM